MTIHLTESAAKQIKTQLAKRGKGLGLRVGVKKVGCSGFAYTYDYADEVRDEDATFESHGTTGWVTIQAQVVPGETFTFAFAIMDMGDSSKATVALLDHWRWDCQGCVPIEVDAMCGEPNHPKCCGLCVDPVDDPLCNTDGHPACCSGL